MLRFGRVWREKYEGRGEILIIEVLPKIKPADLLR
jgi:hypothetical protein